MKKLTFIVALVAMLFNCSVTKADIYSDGITKLFDEDLISGVIPLMNTSNASDAPEEFKKTIIDWMVPKFRENMNETEFKQMMDFYDQPKIKEVSKKLAANLNVSDPALQQKLAPGIMDVLRGKKAADVEEPECTPEYKAAFERNWEICNGDATIKSVVNSVKDMLSSMQSAMGINNGNDNMNELLDYLGRNMKKMAFTVCVTTVTKEDLDTSSSIADQPFYPSYKKTTDAIMGDIPTLMQSIISKR